MSNKTFHTLFDLQLFADGGAGGDGGTGANGTTGVTAGVSDLQAKADAKNPLSNVKYGIQDDGGEASQPATDETETPKVDRNAEFEKLIKGEYKDLYDARMQDTIQKRLKGTKETVEKYEALAPVLDLLGKKYGADASDINALVQAIESDDAFYEEEALKRGLSVEQLKEVKKIERENSEMKKQQQKSRAEEEARKTYATWIQQAEQAKAKYPSLDIETEIQNPQFVSLLKSGIDVETAYTVIHKDDILSSAMQYTAQQVEKKVTNKIIAGQNRPSENGVRSSASALVKTDVSQLNKADREEIARRVARGEKIRF